MNKNPNLIDSRMTTVTLQRGLVPFPETKAYLQPALDMAIHITEQCKSVKDFFDQIFRIGANEALIGYSTCFPADLLAEDFEQLKKLEVEYALTDDSAKRQAIIKQRREVFKQMADTKVQIAGSINQYFVNNGLLARLGMLNEKPKLMNMDTKKGDKEGYTILSNVIRKDPRFSGDPNLEYKLKAVDALKNHASLIKRFQTSRKHIFSNKLNAGSIANRILNDNLDIFRKNCVTLELNLRTDKAFMESLMDATRREYFNVMNYGSLIEQDGIDNYNRMIKGYQKPGADGTYAVKGLNNLINEYNQTHPDNKLKSFTGLQKQILSDNDHVDGGHTPFESIKDFYEALQMIGETFSDMERLNHVFDLVGNDLDAGTVMLKNNLLNNLSKTLTGDYNAFAKKLSDEGVKKVKVPNDGNPFDAYTLESVFKAGALTRTDFIQYVRYAFGALLTPADKREQWNNKLEFDTSNGKKNWNIRTLNRFGSMVTNAETVCQIARKGLQSKRRPNKEEAGSIQMFLESAFAFRKLLILFYVNEDARSSSALQGTLDEYFEEMANMLRSYTTIIRSFITSKVKDTTMVPVDFNFAKFGGGWADSSIGDKGMILAKMDGKYCLLIPNKFITDKLAGTNLISKKLSVDPNGSAEILLVKRYVGKSFTKNFLYEKTYLDQIDYEDREYLDKICDKEQREQVLKKDKNTWNRSCSEICRKLIRIPEISQKVGLPGNAFDECTTLVSVQEHIDQNAFEMSKVPANEQLIKEEIRKGRLLAFHIHSRDMYATKGVKNQHSQLMLAALELDPNVRLLGGCQVMFRPGQRHKRGLIMHQKGSWLLNKYDKDGNALIDENGNNIYIQLYRHLNPRADHPEDNNPELYAKWEDRIVKKIAKFDIVKDRRYMDDQLFFYVPVTVNATGLDGKSVEFQQKLDNLFEELVKKGGYRILSLHCSTGNLVYLTLCDVKGKVLEHRSLNILENDYGQRVNYQSSIQGRMRNMQLVRKSLKDNVANAETSWNKEDQLKDIKDGYLTQVVGLVAEYMRKGDTLLVMDDYRNHSRGNCFDAELLTRFQRAIIQKLAVFRDRHILRGEPGSVTRPLSLSSIVDKNTDLIGRWGLVYIAGLSYINGNIDAKTGFVNYFPNLENIPVSSIGKLFCSFDSIAYNRAEDVFEFTYTASKLPLPTKVKSPIQYTVCTAEKPRVIAQGRDSNGKMKFIEDLNITQKFKDLFSKHSLEWEKGENLVPELKKFGKTKHPFGELRVLFRQLVRMQNSCFADPDQGGYFSPVKGGVHVENRKERDAIDQQTGYNLALKGMAYIDKYLAHAEECRAEGKKIHTLDSVTLEEYMDFFKKFARG